jgi:SEC-C motif-containing protein
MPLCPCGSIKNYEHCCGAYIEKKQVAQSPEQLMRSRYSAYTQAKIDYIISTMKGSPLVNFNKSEAFKWASSVTWIDLQVIQTYLETAEKGFVEFSARFMETRQLKTIHELSEFHFENNAWFYVGGENKQLNKNKNQTKIARNSPCPCGSSKKFKNCHDK